LYKEGSRNAERRTKLQTRTGEQRMADNRGNAGAAGAGAVYGLGFIGALVYYIGTANSFWDGVWGVLQSIVWPAFFVYGVMDKLNIP
jgi:hypothetical protein